MASKAPRTRAGGKWTEAQYNQFIRSLIRKGSVRWPCRAQALERAFVDRRININTGRLAKHFMCAYCGGIHAGSDVAVDHIYSVTLLTGFVSWSDNISRLYVETDKLQVLCNNCHNIKTQAERQVGSRVAGLELSDDDVLELVNETMREMYEDINAA